jgi:hypothetical protein
LELQEPVVVQPDLEPLPEVFLLVRMLEAVQLVTSVVAAESRVAASRAAVEPESEHPR